MSHAEYQRTNFEGVGIPVPVHRAGWCSGNARYTYIDGGGGGCLVRKLGPNTGYAD
jgi:hypothetical protein